MLFPQIRVAATLERAINTALGWGWDKVALDIARAANAAVGSTAVNPNVPTQGQSAVVGTRKSAKKGTYFYVQKQLPKATIALISSICDAYKGGKGGREKVKETRKGGRAMGGTTPNTPAERARISASLEAGGETEEVTETIDLYYLDVNGVHHYVEIKTIKPNYPQLWVAKRNVLLTYALTHGQKVKVFVAMAYNPMGYYGTYDWPTVPFYLDPKHDLMVGRDFWDYIGRADDTYDQLLDCFQTVGHERRVDIAGLFARLS